MNDKKQKTKKQVQVCTEYKKQLFFFCLNILNEYRQADKIVKEVLSAVYSEQVNEKELYLSAARRCAEIYSGDEASSLDEYVDSEIDPDIAFVSENPESHPSGNIDIELSGQFNELVLNLPFQLRIVLMCHYQAGLSPVEIAECLNIPVLSVHSRLYIAGKRLQIEAENLQNENEQIWDILPLLPVIFYDLAMIIEFSKKTSVIVLKTVGGIFAAAILTAGVYYITAKPAKTQPPLNTPTFLPSSTVTAAPTPTKTEQQINQFPVLSRIIYDDGTYLSYEYSNNQILITDSEGNKVLTLEYDINGDKIKEKRYIIGSNQSNERVFDSSGKMIKMIAYGVGEQIESWTEYEYDSNDRKVKEIRYTNQENPDSEIRYEYDRNGNLVKQNEYKNKSFFKQRRYQYDKSGNKIKETVYDASGDLSEQFTYQYNIKNKMVKSTYVTYRNYKIDNSYEYDYDKSGEIIRTVSYYIDGVQKHTEYKVEISPQKDMTKDITFQYNSDGSYYVDERIRNTELYQTVLFNKDGYIVPVYQYAQKENGAISIIEHNRETSIGNYYKDELDSNNNIITRTYYFNDGISEYRCSYQYDNNNRKIGEKHYLHNSIYFWCEYEYNYDGKVSKIIDHMDQSDFYSEYEYNSLGYLNKYSKYDNKGRTITSIEYKYGKDGKLLNKYIIYTAGTLSYSTVYINDDTGTLKRYTYSKKDSTGSYTCEYDLNGNIIKEMAYKSDGSIIIAKVYEYTEENNVSLLTAYDDKGNIKYWIRYAYDSSGNRINWTMYGDAGQVLPKKDTQYDENGNKTKETLYNDAGIIQDEREYDKNGNLVNWTAYDSQSNYFKGEFDLMDTYKYKTFKNCDLTDIIL